ncbi:MAG TPA: formate dehydrogenase subunit gamma [Dongiaceae bacterium]|nr:formate dehydrogenase subunit gamma [Dongiaceae bacterium]
MRNWRRLAARAGGAAIILALVYLVVATVAGWIPLDHPAVAQQGDEVPGGSLGSASDADIWRDVRRGLQGYVSIPDKQAGVLIQSEGQSWRAIRNGPLSVYGAWILLGIVAVVAVFFALRGRIRIDAGASGATVERFNGVERFAHWLTAVSFIVLALSGLNMLYGRYALRPILGPELFADLTRLGKYAHDYLAFAFMAGLVLVFVLWVRDNLPSRADLDWLARGGGFFSRHSHPPARKFNAGQKILFWAVVLGGLSISLSGIALLFPFEFHMFGNTFVVLNVFGLGLPADLTVMQEMQLQQLWHAAASLLLIAVIIGHIYIGTMGMEGAFDAMGSGMVDANWAREHHSLWVAETRKAPAARDD